MTCDYYVQDARTMTTGELAKELHVSRGAIIKWQRAGLIHPEFSLAQRTCCGPPGPWRHLVDTIDGIRRRSATSCAASESRSAQTPASNSRP
jgi:hypothetical protein